MKKIIMLTICSMLLNGCLEKDTDTSSTSPSLGEDKVVISTESTKTVGGTTTTN